MDPLSPLITSLNAEGRPRVWSLVITAFGDLVQHRGGEVSTARLGELLGRIGVESGALRTALSRLGQDGWVLRARSGRLSHYRLSPEGVARFAPATSQIYAPPRMAPVTRWALCVRIGEPAWLCAADCAPEDADCVVTGDITTLTEAFRAALITPAHAAALDALAQDLAATAWAGLAPLDAAAARLLLIHRWRRIVLRYPDLPHEILPDGPARCATRASVAQAYVQVAPEAEAWLDGIGTTLPPMPKADPRFVSRFGPANT